ncbi:MAG: hypothetical protein IJN72_05305 [Firmicutes bacterium]|nr:hypothetical protein [Bacillota bacterium]
MIYKRNLEKMRTEMENRIRFVRKEIIASPQGYLLKTKHGEREEYIHVYYRKGRRIRKRIKPDSEMVAGLLRKSLLEKELELMEKNYKVISSAIEKYTEFSVNQVMNQLPQNLVTDYEKFFAAEKEKAGAGPNQTDYMPEGRIHLTSRGLRVRSKSELIIAEKLYEYGIEFWYEEVLKIGKHTVVPDFTIRRRDGKFFYWEHCGRTCDDEYMARHRRKMKLYGDAGIVPWDNLIVTYDDADGNLNLAAVEGEIKAKLLV